MAKGADRSVLRLLVWEGLALWGFFFIRLHPYADPVWGLNFFYNALFFLVVYPLLYVYRWKMTDGCLSTVMWPLSFVLNWALGVSCYLWVTYLFLILNSPFFGALTRHYVVLGFLFAFVYFPLVQAILGVGKNYQTLGQLVWVLLYSTLGGFFGFETGWFLSRKFPTLRTDSAHWFLVWVGIILIGLAAGAILGQKRGKG